MLHIIFGEYDKGIRDGGDEIQTQVYYLEMNVA